MRTSNTNCLRFSAREIAAVLIALALLAAGPVVLRVTGGSVLRPAPKSVHVRPIEARPLEAPQADRNQTTAHAAAISAAGDVTA